LVIEKREVQEKLMELDNWKERQKEDKFKQRWALLYDCKIWPPKKKKFVGIGTACTASGRPCCHNRTRRKDQRIREIKADVSAGIPRALIDFQLIVQNFKLDDEVASMKAEIISKQEHKKQMINTFNQNIERLGEVCDVLSLSALLIFNTGRVAVQGMESVGAKAMAGLGGSLKQGPFWVDKGGKGFGFSFCLCC